jgi:sensor histidine kinase regulating citrate/malate metabolism
LENSKRVCLPCIKAEIRLVITCLNDDKMISIECTDSGPGFNRDILEMIHEGQLRPPSSPDKGGYGLYLIMEIVHRLTGAKFLASNQKPSGARVQILLPSERIAQ